MNDLERIINEFNQEWLKPKKIFFEPGMTYGKNTQGFSSSGHDLKQHSMG